MPLGLGNRGRLTKVCTQPLLLVWTNQPHTVYGECLCINTSWLIFVYRCLWMAASVWSLWIIYFVMSMVFMTTFRSFQFWKNDQKSDSGQKKLVGPLPLIFIHFNLSAVIQLSQLQFRQLASCRLNHLIKKLVIQCWARNRTRLDMHLKNSPFWMLYRSLPGN